ncbi:MAG: cell wall-binding repeat-containing protein [Bacillota bacterium]|nr:cell wall-binding repeat-containing protein [Bacillota bacterium]
MINTITNRTLKKGFYITLTSGILFGVLLIYLIFLYKPNYYETNITSKDIPITSATRNTMRIYGDNFFETSAAISRFAYPATFSDNRPNAIILVREDRKEDAILAAQLIKYPINAPILYTYKDSIPNTILREMKRLSPQGVVLDRNSKVYLIGDLGNGVKDEVVKLGWNFRELKGNDTYELSKNIDDYIAAYKGSHNDKVVVAPIEASDYALMETAWSAHSGDVFFFIKKDSIPDKVAEALKFRRGGAYIYVLGDDSVISPKVQSELSKYGHVQRISDANDIYTQAIDFTRYRDVGKNFSWWFGRKTTEFGWNIEKSGHNFIFATLDDWHLPAASAVLAYKSEHGPILFVKKSSIPAVVQKYLSDIRPMDVSVQEKMNNYGVIIGSKDFIDENIQGQLDELLS